MLRTQTSWTSKFRYYTIPLNVDRCNTNWVHSTYVLEPSTVHVQSALHEIASKDKNQSAECGAAGRRPLRTWCFWRGAAPIVEARVSPRGARLCRSRGPETKVSCRRVKEIPLRTRSQPLYVGIRLRICT